MKMNIFQKGFNLSQDGAGNRLVLHMQGCNMRCRWCSNPESFLTYGTIMADKQWLISSICENGAIENKSLDRKICDSCTSKNCLKKKNKGVRLSCKEYEISELISEAVECKPLFFENGGITVSGGEPTMQYEAVSALFKALKKEGINTCMETNGTSEKLIELSDDIDYLIMDFKHYDNTKHREFTGIGNEVVLRNLANLNDRSVLIRIPLIGGFNASKEEAERFAWLLKGMKNAEFEFLKYHNYGEIKWEKCGLEYKMENGDVSDETLRYFEKTFIDSGLRVIHT